MKKTLFCSIVAFVGLTSNAQELVASDAMQYSIDNLNGTARFRGMSGAFGALGGDLSALSVNPAGAVYFNTNVFSASLSNFNTNNKATYFGTNQTETDSKLSINQIGFAMPFLDNTKKWNKLAFGVTYENTNNFSNQVYLSGVNPNNSIGSYFVNKAQGIALSNLKLLSGETYTSLYQYLGENVGFNAQQAMLAYNAYVINPVTDLDSNVLYTSNIPAGGNYKQTDYLVSDGYNGKITANFAAQYDNKLSLGININAYFSDYERTTTLTETNTNTPAQGIQYVQFENHLQSESSGFSFDLGAIYSVSKEIRLGLAYASPTWYKITDQLSQRLTSRDADLGVLYTNTVNPDVVNVYEPYKLKTPQKITISGAYLFDKKGLISIDYGIKDYRNAQFSPKRDDYYQSLNESTENLLQSAYLLNVGAEYKINEISLRGGYRFEQSPYKDGEYIGDLTGFSAGLGYDFDDDRLDLSYSYAQRSYNQTLISSGMSDTAQIKALQNNFTLTYTLKF